MDYFQSNRSAFTLIETLIVVIVLGIVAAVVVPVVSGAQEQARQETFRTTLNKLIKISQLHLEENGSLPAQGAGAPIPPAIYEDVFGDANFPSRTPLGGYWHVGYFTDVDRWGVGVWWDTDEPHVQDSIITLDEQIDDGVQTTGSFQVRDNARYYWLIN